MSEKTIAEKLTEIAENIPIIRQKAYAEGYNNGLSSADAYETGYEQGVEAGKKSVYDYYWDARQDYGNRTVYNYGFYYESMTDKWFYPKYDICPTKASYFMRDLGIYKANGTAANDNELFDLVERLEECGRKMDFSKCTDVTYLFYQARISRLPELNLTAAGGSTQYLLFGSKIHTIDKIIVNETNLLTEAFLYASRLENVVIEGVIAIESGTIKSIKLTDCKSLTLASAISFITHLKDYSGTASEGINSIKFHNDVWALLDADGNNSPNGNTWREYIHDLGWTI